MPEDTNQQDSSYSHSTMDALMVVKGTINDLGGFCERNEATCTAGQKFFSSLGTRARDGAGILYQFLDKQFGNPETQETPASPS